MEDKINKNSGEIYLITNKINNKQYIGQVYSYYVNNSRYGINGRWSKHKSASKNKNWEKKCRALYTAIRKYGEDNFTCILIDVVDVKDLNDKEIFYIKQYNTLSPNGYNLTEGGSNGIRSQETREKMSKMWMGHVISDETKKKISESLTGEKNPNWGKKHKPETLAKMSEKQKGDKHPMYGKKHKLENRDKISNTLRKHDKDLNLPRYVYRYLTQKHNGYKVAYFIDGIKKEKTFTDKKLSLKEKLNKALEFHKLKYSN